MTHPTEQAELLPCPFCCYNKGDTRYKPRVWEDRRGRMTLPWVVECNNCGAAITHNESEKLAIDMWNTRTPAQPAERWRDAVEHTVRQWLEEHNGQVDWLNPSVALPNGDWEMFPDLQDLVNRLAALRALSGERGGENE